MSANSKNEKKQTSILGHFTGTSKYWFFKGSDWQHAGLGWQRIGGTMRIELSSIADNFPASAPKAALAKENMTKVTKLTANSDIVEISYDYSGVDEKGLPKNIFWGIGGRKIDIPSGSGEKLRRQLEKVYEDYYTGQCDEKTVEDTLTEVVESFRDMYMEIGYEEQDIMPRILEGVYAYARMDVVYGADTASYYEGRKLAALYNEPGRTSKDFIYYDSDYYYKCEDMKTALFEHVKALGEKYGATNLKIRRGYDRSDLRYYASSYNTIINHYAGYQWNIGNMLDENMEPPRNFKFFHKNGDRGTNIYPDSLTEVLGDGSDIFDGVLHVWQDDWSFVGRVPVRSHAIRNPAVNMYDVVKNGSPGGIPEKCVSFLKNFDFFSPVQYDNYFRLRHFRYFDR